MRVFIMAYENIYGGLHGMNTFRVLDVNSLEEADEVGSEMSYDIIQSYGSIMESLEDEIDPDIEENSEEWEEELDNLINEDKAWEVYVIDENKAHDVSNEVLEMTYYGIIEDFVKEYCIDPDEKI